MTQQQLADLLGIDRETVNKWVNHSRKPGPKWRPRLAAVFNVDSDYFAPPDPYREAVEQLGGAAAEVASAARDLAREAR